MKSENTLIICASFHHNNTLSIGIKIAEVLNAKIIEPKDFKEEMLGNYELIGFGSGIYNRKHHNSIFDLVSNISEQKGKQAFIFSTSTVPLKSTHKPLNDILIKKGFEIIGQYYGKGFMDYSFAKYIFGGLNKGRPNEEDYNKAVNFAIKIKEDQNIK